VTFRRRVPAAAAGSALVCEDLDCWSARAAPAPAEVRWGALGMRRWERASRGSIAWAAFWALALFYLIPVTAVQALVGSSSVVG
jgi:hypothetical protein